METQFYYFMVNFKWNETGNYSNDGCYFYKIVIDEKNINIYEAPHSFSWKNYDKLPCDDKFNKPIKSLGIKLRHNRRSGVGYVEYQDDEDVIDILNDDIHIITYYREQMHRRISKYTYVDSSWITTYEWYSIVTFLIDMKALNQREYLSKKEIMKEIAKNGEMINDTIEKYKNARSDGYIEGVNICMDMKSESLIKLEQKHIEMKTYFQNKIKNLNNLNEELQKLNSLLKSEIKITRLENASNEIKALEDFKSEVLDKENYLENELKNSDENGTDKVEISNKIKIINELYYELDEKIRVLNVKIDPTTSTRRGTEYAGTDCYICDDYCHYYCSCDCHDNDIEQEEPTIIKVKKFEYKGKKYKLSLDDNTLYDWDTHKPIGTWNPKMKPISKLLK